MEFKREMRKLAPFLILSLVWDNLIHAFSGSRKYENTTI